MKTIILAALLFVFGSGVSAQQSKQKKLTRTPHAVQPDTKVDKAAQNTSLISLNSTSANEAFAERSPVNSFHIADPTIKWFNQIYDYRHPDGNAVIGVPKLSNGIAHGRIIFYPTHSGGSGSFTGTGSVGTGTSIGSIGTSGSVSGVNGKNPYAGPGIYGSRVLNDMRDKEEQAGSLLPAKKD
jgi:hypothetical protein